MIGGNITVETVNAAASAIISSENRVQQITVPRRRWRVCFSGYWCFGSQKHVKQINRAVLVPEPTPLGPEANISENSSHRPPLTLPFIAPPSSPASFLNSELQSSTRPPVAFLSLSPLSENTRPSIFAIGPYANETRLVSPPVFSTFTTEPSTANFTPPPEPIQSIVPEGDDESPSSHMVSFQLSAEEVKRGMEKKPDRPERSIRRQ